MSRELTCLASTINEAGVPVFAFLCDCATTTGVAVEDLGKDGNLDKLEFAFTCDGCGESHWLTIEKAGETP